MRGIWDRCVRATVTGSVLAALFAAPAALIALPADKDSPRQEKELRRAQGLTRFQAVHADLVKESRRAAEGREPVVREVPEPSAEFDKQELRRRFGDFTRDVGRAWTPDPKRKATLGPSSFAVDLTAEAIDLNTASGISGFLYTPPDTMGAAGPTQFVTTLNGVYRFHDKTTGVPDTDLDVADNSFWVPAVDPNDNGGGDPRVRFDRLTDTWIIIAFDLAPGNSLANNRLLIAQSDGPVISAGTVWTQWFIIPRDTVDGSSNNGCFADYPMLGVDVNAIYLGANMFAVASPCSGTQTAVFVLPKAQLPGGGGSANSVTTAFSGLLSSGPIWSPMPADNFDPAADTGYVIGHNANSDTELLLGKIANPGGAPGTPTLTFTPITVSNKNDGWSSGDHDRGVAYPGVPDPTAPDWGLDPLGFRPLGGAHVRDGRLWTTMTSSVDGPDGDLVLWPDVGDRNSVVFFEIDVTTDTLIQDGNVFDGVTAQDSDPTHLFMGSVMVNGQGHALVGATGNNTSDIAPSGYWAARLAGDPLGEFSEPASYFAGTDTGDMRQSFENNPRATRWGDYSMVTVDPCDDMTFYTIQEYQDAPPVTTGGNWGTALARILAPAPTFDSVSPTSIPAGSPSTVVTVTGTGFYNPPTEGMSSCRIDLDATTAFAGLSINSVTFNGPTEIEIDFDSTAAGDGTATVSVINPDGQTVDFSLGVGGGGGEGPIADISPDAFDFTVPQGGSETQTLNVGNIGDADLTWSIDEAEGGSLRRSFSDVRARRAPADAGRALPRVVPLGDVLLDEGFEDGTIPPPDWTHEATNTDFTWEINDFNPQSGALYTSVFFDPDLVPQDEWLLSPPMTLDSGVLTFWSLGSLFWCREDNDNCDLDVWIVVGDVGGGDDVHVGLADDDWPDNFVWAQSSFDLTDLLPGGEVRIGFQYSGVDGAEVSLDTITLTGEVGPGGCTPTDIPWLSATPTSGTTAPDTSEPVDVAVDASALDPGDYSARLCVNTNDPDAPQVEVPVNLTVTADGPPIADITPDSFAFTVPEGGSDGDTLNLGNVGGSDLTWDIHEATPFVVPEGAPYRYGIVGAQEFHSPVGGSRASGISRGRGEAPADPVVPPAPQPAAIGDFAEGFDDITQLPGAGWAMINNSDPEGPSSWFQGNETIFESHEGAPDAYIAANYESAGDGGDISNWLLTPEVTIVNGTELCFWTRTTEQFEEFYDRLEVRMSVEGDSIDVGDTADSVGDFLDLMYTVNPDLEEGGYPEDWEEICVTVRERSRQPVTGRFAFRYWVPDTSVNGDYIGIDTVSVKQPDDIPDGGCDNPADIPWLAVDPTSGTTAPGASVPAEVSVDTTGLDQGDYSALLCVTTNDPEAELVEVPVDLTVTEGGGGDPAIDVDPVSLDSTLPQDGSETQSLTVANLGDGTLDWQVTETAPGVRQVSRPRAATASMSAAASAVARPRTKTETRDARVSDLRSQLGSPLPSLRMVNPALGGDGVDCELEAGIIIHDDGTLENGYSGNPDAGITEMQFVDKFTPTVYPAPFSAVCLGFITGSGPTTYDVEVVAFDDDGPGGEPGTELGSMTATVEVTQIPVPIPPDTMAVWNSVDISSLGLEVADGSVYIGARWAPAGSQLANVFIAADQSTDRPVGFAGGFWWNNDSAEWIPIQDPLNGFPDYRSLLVRAVGPLDCTLPSWVSVDPTSGSVPAGGEQSVDVTFDTAGLDLGNYSANLCLESNDPDNPLVVVPLGLTVTLDTSLDEPLEIPDFDVVSPANGGEPVVMAIPAGVLTQGDVVGFSFVGTASGISGNSSWASDTCMIVEAPDGTVFGVGGISGTNPDCAVNDWDFQGGDSTEDGTYESAHADVFPGLGDAGDWTFTFINDWNSESAATISWTDVTVTLHKVAPAAPVARAGRR